jgi:hypothetical protein
MATDLSSPSDIPLVGVVTEIDASAPARAEAHAPNFQSEPRYKTASTPKHHNAAALALFESVEGNATDGQPAEVPVHLNLWRHTTSEASVSSHDTQFSRRV